MLRYTLNYWSVVLFLLAQLVLGELTHAIPEGHAPATPQRHVQLADAPCPEHSTQALAASTPIADEHSIEKVHDVSVPHPDDACCQGDACECQCLHFPVVLLPAPLCAMPMQSLAVLRMNLDGVVEPDLSGLFRPPA